MEESILVSIKLMLGVMEDYEAFDQQIIICINTALNALTQLGIGPKYGFTIRDKSTTWGEFLGDDLRMEAAKMDVYIRVRLAFDPPTSGTMQQALEDQKSEIEWRLLSDMTHPDV